MPSVKLRKYHARPGSRTARVRPVLRLLPAARRKIAVNRRSARPKDLKLGRADVLTYYGLPMPASASGGHFPAVDSELSYILLLHLPIWSAPHRHELRRDGYKTNLETFAVTIQNSAPRLVHTICSGNTKHPGHPAGL